MYKTKKRIYITAIVIFLIFIIAFIFPYPIFIQDALSLQAVPDYGIKISNWRIIFEPIIGLFLYFNRVLYPLAELKFVLIWALLILFIVGVIKFIRTKNKKDRKSISIKLLINMIIAIGLWFTWLSIILFIPLPNNTIINNAPNSVLVTTHAHTEYSHDGLISEKNMWKWQKYNGFDAFFITDHANHKKTNAFVNKQRNGDFPIAPLVMTGEEYSASNHLSLLGINDKFTTNGMKDFTAIDTVHFYHGAVLINHWFSDKHNSLEYYKNLNADGFEIENVGKELYYDRKLKDTIKRFCTKNKLMMVGGLDFHGYGRSCSIWNAFDIPGWHKLNPQNKERAILNILKSRDQSKIKVLMYNDRPFHKNENLFFSPFITLFTYFRTLNIYQLLSWVLWILLFNSIQQFIKRKNYSTDKITTIIGLLGAGFILLLGLFYYLKIDTIIGYTKMYKEYSTLLFKVGLIFMGYMLVLFYFRFINKKAIKK